MDRGNPSRTFLWLILMVIGAASGLAFWQYRTIAGLRSQLEGRDRQLADIKRQDLAGQSGAGELSPDERGELERLRAEHSELIRLRGEAGRWRDAAAAENSQSELSRLREEHKDLLRLRGEVSRLQEQSLELEKLRSANSRLLQIVQDAGTTNLAASTMNVRKQGAVLGVQIIPNAPNQAYAGAMIGGFLSNAPAASSDLKRGDIIIAVDGRRIESMTQVQAEMLTRSPGQTVILDVMRDGTALRIPVQTMAWQE